MGWQIIILKMILGSLALIAFFTGIQAIALGTVSNTALTNATIDSEFRFLAVSWLGFGGWVAWVALNLKTQHHWIPMIAMVPLLGGLARCLSVIQVGWPANHYVIAIYAEFGYAIAILSLFMMTRKPIA